MIFFTAGTQLPFDRLAEIAFQSAKALSAEKVIYQAGPNGKTYFKKHFLPTNLIIKNFFTPLDYAALLEEANCVVTHAGIGNILSLLEFEKEFLILPRLAEYGEHRNNHQLDTAQAIKSRFNIDFYLDESILIERLLTYRYPSKRLCHLQSIMARRQKFGDRLKNIIYQL